MTTEQIHQAIGHAVEYGLKDVTIKAILGVTDKDIEAYIANK